MKKIVSLVLLSVALLGGEDWLHSYEEAQAQALKEKKNIMVMLSSENCDACWYMENIVFEDDAVHTLLMSNFVPVYLDVNNDFIPDKFKFIGTPTFYFSDANGTKIGHRINGASNVKDFTKTVNKILEEVKKVKP